MGLHSVYGRAGTNVVFTPLAMSSGRSCEWILLSLFRWALPNKKKSSCHLTLLGFLLATITGCVFTLTSTTIAVSLQRRCFCGGVAAMAH